MQHHRGAKAKDRRPTIVELRAPVSELGSKYSCLVLLANRKRDLVTTERVSGRAHWFSLRRLCSGTRTASSVPDMPAEGRCGKRRTRSGLEALRAPARYPNHLAGGKDSKPTRPSRSILNVKGGEYKLEQSEPRPAVVEARLNRPLGSS
jgi:hypothetical protein